MQTITISVGKEPPHEILTISNDPRNGIAPQESEDNRRPDQISIDEIREWMHFLITEKQLAFSSCNQKLAGIRFFYREVLQLSEFGVELRVPTKGTGRLPEPLSRSEIVRLLDAASSGKARMMLMTCYATGVRLSELLNLRFEDIHAKRMVVRIRQGKGRKDRYTLLSPRLLTELREYWRKYRPSQWLFENQKYGGPLNPSTPQKAYQDAKLRAGITHGQGIHTLWHAFATHLLETGLDLPTIQRLMGHTSLSKILPFVSSFSIATPSSYEPFS